MFWRLTTVADDFGRFESDPRILLANCFPLKAGLIKVDTIKKRYAELEVCGLVRSYVVNSKHLGFFVTWDTYQRRRASQSKYPAPSDDNTCCQALSDSAEESRNRGIEESRNRGEGGNGTGPAKPKPVNLTDEEWIETLKENPAYKGIDIEKVQGKLVAWCGIKNLKPTRKRLLNWLNREDRPMESGKTEEEKIQEWANES